MLLTIDVGNTNMEFGVFAGTQRKASFRLGTKHDITSDEIGLFLRQFLQIHEIITEEIEDVVIASVVPQVIYSVCNAMRKYVGRKPLLAGEDLPIPLKNRYAKPAEVGADRLVNGYAGFTKYGGGLVVVDFGTATTFDVISKEGVYLGGAIYPGIKISLDALVAKASKLSKIEIDTPRQVIGTDTAMSMQSGLLYGYTGAVEHIITHCEEEIGHNLKVVATGGLSRFIATHTKMKMTLDSALTLEGLAMVYEQAKRGKGFRR